MHPLIQLLSSELVAVIKRIDNSNFDMSDVDDMNEVITVLRKTTHRDKPMSKYTACEYLHVSRATFDNYVAEGVCDIIYPINLKEDEQKGLDGNGGVFSYITDIRRWLRTDCADST